jgi:hypothetical protein
MPPLTLKELEQKVLSNPSNTNLNNWWNAAIEAQLICFEAQNEQNPIGDLLKCSVRPMQLKADSGHQQVGDYVFKIKNTWVRIVFERKSVADLYSTLFTKNNSGESNRDRLKREIQRFYNDCRFNLCDDIKGFEALGSFIVICEGTYQEYLKYVPERHYCKFCKYYKPNITPEGDMDSIGICVWDKEEPLIKNETDDCNEFVDFKTVDERINRMANSKKAAIDSLNSMPQVQVLFCESREDMAERMMSIVKLWSFHNWKEVLNNG